MKIWLLYLSEDLPLNKGTRLLRTAHLANNLADRGHSVTWWTTAFDHASKEWTFQKDEEISLRENYKIIALKGCGYKKNFSLKRYADHKLVAWKFKKMAGQAPKPDVIVGMLPYYDITYEAVKYGLKHDIPIIVDIRDLWPDIFLDHITPPLRNLLKLILFMDYQKNKFILKHAHSINSMMEGILTWGLQMVSRTRTSLDRVFYLGARKIESKPVKKFTDLAQFLNNDKRFVVTFIGSFGAYYNPITLIQAARKLNEHDFYFILGGDGIYSQELKNAANGLKNVYFPGWLSENEIKYLLSLSSVGLVSCNLETLAFPNKAFIYFSGGLPIISSLRGELKDIIEKHQIGLYYTAGDPESLAQAILKLHSDKQLYSDMVSNVDKIFEEMFDADKIYLEYSKHIENVLAHYYKKRV